MLWVLDHPRDLMADFRAIYHLSPREAMDIPFPEYLALAYRLPAYQGVMSHRMAEAAAVDRRSNPRRARMVEGEREAIARDPDLRDAISFS
jgi:hypothetical protein